MQIDNDVKLDFSSVLIRPKMSDSPHTSRADIDITRPFKFKWSKREYIGTPIISANMDTVSTFEMASALNKLDLGAALHKHYTEEQLIEYFSIGRTNVWYSMGISEADMTKYNNVKNAIRKNKGWDDESSANRLAIKYVCIDVANGYSRNFVKFIERFRTENPLVTIMAGNVVTADITVQLIFSGADIVKVGIGPGSVCTTRKITGVGYPQLSAVMECAEAAHGVGGLVCSDGGCVEPGDVAKAFGGGADFVMLGGMLAGHKECGGQLVTETGRPFSTPLAELMGQHEKVFVEFYGMSSKAAQDKHNGGLANYRASEGKRVLIPYKGPVENTVKEILGGLRSACMYVGATQLKSLSKCTTFIRVDNTRNRVFDKYDA